MRLPVLLSTQVNKMSQPTARHIINVGGTKMSPNLWLTNVTPLEITKRITYAGLFCFVPQGAFFLLSPNSARQEQSIALGVGCVDGY